MATELQLEELRKRFNYDGGKVLDHLEKYRQGSSVTRFSQETENAISTASNRVGVPRNLLKAVVHFFSGGDYFLNEEPRRMGGWVYLPFVGITFYEGRSYELNADWRSRYFAPNRLVQCVVAARELKNRAEDGGSWKSAVRDYLSANRFDYIAGRPWGKTSEQAVQRVLDLWKTYDEADIEYRDQGWGALVGWSTWSDLLLRKEKECKDLERQNSLLKFQQNTDKMTIERLQRENAELRARNFALNTGLAHANDIRIMNQELENAKGVRNAYRDQCNRNGEKIAKQASEIKFLDNEFKGLTDKYQVAEKLIQSLEKDLQTAYGEVQKRNAVLRLVKQNLLNITSADFDTSSFDAMSKSKVYARKALSDISGLAPWSPEHPSMKSAFLDKFNEEENRLRLERERNTFYGHPDPFRASPNPPSYIRGYEFPPRPPVKTQEERIFTLEQDVQGLKLDVAKNAISNAMNSAKIAEEKRMRELFGGSPPEPSGSTTNAEPVNPCGCKVS